MKYKKMVESRNFILVLWLFVICCNIHTASGAYELLLSCGNRVANGSDCTMTCDTKTTTETIILWLNGSTSTTINKGANCADAGDLPYESSCNTPGKFDLKITNAQYGRDSYAWSCTSPFGGAPSNATDGDTFVSVPLTRVTLTRPTATSISCVAVSSPAATVTLYEVSPPSQDNVVNTEASFAKTLEGLRTNLTSLVNESGTYYCHADNVVDGEVVSEASVPESPTTASPTTPSPPASHTNTASGDNLTTDEVIMIVFGVVGGLVVAVLVVVLVHKYCKKKVHSQDRKKQAMTTTAEPKRISSNL